MAFNVCYPRPNRNEMRLLRNVREKKIGQGLPNIHLAYVSGKEISIPENFQA